MKIALIDFMDWDYTVASVRTSPLGGTQSAACYLCEELALGGHEVYLINRTNTPGDFLGVHHLFGPSLPADKLVELGLDALIVLQKPSLGTSLKQTLGDRTRLILWATDASDQVNVQPLYDPAQRAAYDGFALVSQWQSDQYAREFQIDPARSRVLLNAVAPVFANLFPDGRAILPRKIWPPILAYTSAPDRGLEILLNVFPQIRAEIPGTRLLVFSSMKLYRTSDEEDAKQFGGLYDLCKSTEGVEYVGVLPQAQLAQRLAEVSVLAYPSILPETSCIAAMEAMAAGCRIVTSDRGALPETTAGFARLVPFNSLFDKASLREFSRKFADSTIAALREQRDQPEIVSDLLSRQWDYTKEHYLWKPRAAEWVKWVAELPAHAPATMSATAADPRAARIMQLRHSGRRDLAAVELQKFLAEQPNHPEALILAAYTEFENGRLEAALDPLLRAIRIAPNVSHYLQTAGLVLAALGRSQEAIWSLRKAVSLHPQNPDYHASLAHALKEAGQADEAVESYRESLKLHPDQPRTRSSLLLAMHYTERNLDEIHTEHLQWNQLHADPSTSSGQGLSNSPDPDRRLRIGYFSPDFCAHSVAYFFEPLLLHHDPAQADVYCYAHVPRSDEVTERFKRKSPNWREITRASDAELAEIIRRDQIDILVDLAGHTVHNRLGVFARKPAPIQVSYLGYPDTTGLTAMDYRLTDAYADPPGWGESLHTEKLVRLPRGFLCYMPPRDAPPVAPPPAERSGVVTFASFNALAKITPRMLAIWARILLQVPESRLILKSHSGLSDQATRKRLLETFAVAGVEPHRVELHGRIATLAAHLELYHRVDIALDTFPYCGTTTTCEAMWMGVPVITLAGRAHVSRVGVSLLMQMGLPEMIAETPDGYVRKAAKLAADLPALADLRTNLRPRLSASPLMDGPGFARNVETAYRQMWHTWCQNRA
jgi:predicted O-linked N-acetylglucosamine transferase (SPINDLY family)/glycosyltransferase involved in cell wall biosynthesis